jgi:hypothetical protein
MLRATILALATACVMFGTSASAHVSGHGRPDPVEVCATAAQTAAYLVTNDVGKEWGTLPPSWADIPPTQIEILAEVDGYFVTAVRNREEEKTLYVLVVGAGEALDANFTGTFAYVYDGEDADGSAAGVACQGR